MYSKLVFSSLRILLCVKEKKIPLFAVPKVFLVDEDSYTLQEGGGREKHYNSGSSIDIHCVVNNYLPYFKAVIWTHNGHTITQDSGHGGIRYVSKQSKGGQRLTGKASFIYFFLILASKPSSTIPQPTATCTLAWPLQQIQEPTLAM